MFPTRGDSFSSEKLLTDDNPVKSEKWELPPFLPIGPEGEYFIFKLSMRESDVGVGIGIVMGLVIKFCLSLCESGIFGVTAVDTIAC